MQTANTASLLVESSLASVGTVQLAMYTCAILRLAATCIRWLTPSGTVGSSNHAGLVLNALQRWEELLWLLIPAFAYSLVVATRLGSIYIVV